MAPPSKRFSDSTFLRLWASALGTIFVAFGVNAIARPAHALTFFEWDLPSPSSEYRKVVEGLMIVYGARDVFMGLAIYAAAWYRNTRALGWIVIAGSGVAYVDGIACYLAGKGEWNHWGYAPMLTVVGALLAGVLDRA